MRAITGMLLLVLLVACQGEKTDRVADKPRPSFLIIQADDLGYDDLALHGNPYLATPHIDSLGLEGIRFDRFYVNAVCAPTRASLLTGQHFLRTGVSHVHGGKDYLARSVPTLADHFAEAGYVCGMWGKWHSGKAEGYYPWQRGFHEAFQSRLYQHRRAGGRLNGQPVQTEKWSDELLVDYALRFMEAHRDTNFVAYLSSLTCHEPLDAPAAAIQPYLDQGLPEGLATLYGMVHHFDQQIGRLVAGMEQLGLMEETLIVFLSDNGPAVNNRVLTEHGRRLRKVNGFKGWKGNLWENGLRSPLFVYWKGHLPAYRRRELVSVTDILPTLLDLAGASTLTAAEFDGQPFTRLLSKKTAPDWNNTHFDFVQPGWQPTDAPWTPEGVGDEYAPVEMEKAQLKAEEQPLAVVTEAYKWIQHPGPAEGYELPLPEQVLFDLNSDPTESVNLADSLPATAEAMQARAQQWFEGIKAGQHSFVGPTFTIQAIGASRLALYAPIEVQGNLRVAYNFLHQLEKGSAAVYRIDVEEAGRYAVRFTPSAVEGSYVISTEDGHSVQLPAGTPSVLPLQKGLQTLTLKLLHSFPGGELRYLELRRE